jgi:membrane-associated protease RseP (regulator of RpoE activity)
MPSPAPLAPRASNPGTPSAMLPPPPAREPIVVRARGPNVPPRTPRPAMRATQASYRATPSLPSRACAVCVVRARMMCARHVQVRLEKSSTHGFGMNIDNRGVVVSVVPRSPAAQSGVPAGAQIVGVNGAAVDGKPDIYAQLGASGASKRVAEFSLQLADSTPPSTPSTPPPPTAASSGELGEPPSGEQLLRTPSNLKQTRTITTSTVRLEKSPKFGFGGAMVSAP